MADPVGAEQSRDVMARRLRWQADACRELGSPLYGILLDHVATDVLAGGPSADVLAGHEDDRGVSALALRLMGSVHRLALERRAPELARFYPSVGDRLRLGRLRVRWPSRARVPATVHRESARDFVRRVEPAPGTTTVIWHSIMWQYLDPGEASDALARIDELGMSAGRWGTLRARTGVACPEAF